VRGRLVSLGGGRPHRPRRTDRLVAVRLARPDGRLHRPLDAHRCLTARSDGVRQQSSCCLRRPRLSAASRSPSLCADSFGQSLDATTHASYIEINVHQLVAEFRPILMRWMTVPLPVTNSTDETWRMARMELAISESRVARRCYRADLDQCKAFFGLTAVADP